MTAYTQHKKEWKDCKRCILHKERKQVVFARGVLPADILFIGETPGDSEDVLGRPFVGPAGKLLDHIIKKAGVDKFRFALTNLVCCIPKRYGYKVEPEDLWIKACAPRLLSFVKICQPDLIVRVGGLSQKWARVTTSPFSSTSVRKWVNIMHPAGIRRLDVSQKPLAIQRTIVTLADAIDDL